jgi:hypothetical protein
MINYFEKWTKQGRFVKGGFKKWINFFIRFF